MYSGLLAKANCLCSHPEFELGVDALPLESALCFAPVADASTKLCVGSWVTLTFDQLSIWEQGERCEEERLM